MHKDVAKLVHQWLLKLRHGNKPDMWFKSSARIAGERRRGGVSINLDGFDMTRVTSCADSESVVYRVRNEARQYNYNTTWYCVGYLTSCKTLTWSWRQSRVNQSIKVGRICWKGRFWAWSEQQLSYRKHIARQLCTQYDEGIYRPKYYTVTLKSRLRVTQGHWKQNHWIDHLWLTISRVIWHWILSWPWNMGERSLKVIESGTIWKLGYGFCRAMRCISAAYAVMRCVCVCVCVCPSRSWVASKWIKISSKFFHRRVAKPF